MKALETLRTNLSEESKAYGYTLSIWGSGAILVGQYGVPAASEVLMFILGGVIGFGVLATIAFRGVWKSVERQTQDTYIVASMIHILASFGNVVVSYALIALLSSSIASTYVFLLVGLHASFSYNILLLLEEYLSEYIVMAEARITQQVGPE